MSMSHVLIAAIIVMVLMMGPNKLPQLGRGLGDAIRGFKKGMNGEGEDEIDVTHSTQEKLTEAEWAARQSAKEANKEKA